ncbi:protein SIP4 [Kluyveromyces marxianus]|nr:protein SIP4 [Kluyveromyces marxianus]
MPSVTDDPQGMKREQLVGPAGAGPDSDSAASSSSNYNNNSSSTNTNHGNGHGNGNGTKKRKYGKVDRHNEKELLPTPLVKKKRFSQACDRCRLKKVKCDGLKPSCTNCRKIGYHCSTSDKLTRRGFPRGYTEMLESEIIKLQRMCGLIDENGETVAEGSEEQLRRLQNNMAMASDGTCNPSAAGNVNVNINVSQQNPNVTDDITKDQQPPASASTGSFLPFINDTFHKFPNYIHDQVYLGNFTWNCIINANKPYLKSWQYNRSLVHDPVLSFLSLHFPLSSSGVPTNIPLSTEDLMRLIDKYLHSNQIFPYLLGDSWHQRIMSVLTGSSTACDPAVSIVLILIVQFELNCFPKETVFQAIKLFGALSQDRLCAIQLINFGIRYFMSQENSYAVIWTNDLISFNQYMITNSALFLNYNNLVGHEHSTSKTIRLLTFYQFQIFQIWWSFINGLPKTNFLTDEFHPPLIQDFPPNLKMFQLVYDFIIQLDGCHLQLLVNKTNNKYQYLIESFGYKLIYQWKVYHHLQDHDFKQIQLENNDLLEIGITLVYLVCRYLQQPKSIELSYEIISLYWLILSDNSNVKPINSRILKTVQFMPLNNKQLIENCLVNLLNEPKQSFNWFKYKKLLKRWVTIWMDDNDIFSKLISHYQLPIGMTDISPTVSNFKPLEIVMDPVADPSSLFKIYNDVDNFIDDEGYEEDNESDYQELVILPKRRTIGHHHPSAKASSIHKNTTRTDFSLFNNKIDHIIIKE